MLGKQKMTKLTHPRNMLMEKSSPMLYTAKKRDMAGRRPSVIIERMLAKYLPLLASVLSRTLPTSRCSGELEDGGHRGVLTSSSSLGLGLKISHQK